MDYTNIAPRHAVCEERKVTSEREDRMRVDIENMDVRLEEERKRSAELLMQVKPTLTVMLPRESLLTENYLFIYKVNHSLYQSSRGVLNLKIRFYLMKQRSSIDICEFLNGI